LAFITFVTLASDASIADEKKTSTSTVPSLGLLEEKPALAA
jgi:hypothetical protein